MTQVTSRAKRPYRSPLRNEQAQLTRRQVLDAASRLFVSRGYRAVTVEDIAGAAGVAPQTIYVAFKTKLAIAQQIIWSSFETEGIHELMADARDTRELLASLALGARITRRLNERFAVIAQFMRESGDPGLLAEFKKIENLRLDQIEQEVGPILRTAVRQLRSGLSSGDAIASIWALTGTDLYQQLVIRRGWTPDRYEAWLRDTLTQTIVEPSATPSGRRSR